MKKTMNLFLLIFAIIVVDSGLINASDKENFKVYINNVDVTGLKNQEFKGCTVKFDENGNIYIDAPQYKIKRLDAQEGDNSPPPSTAIVKTEKKSDTTPQKKYFLVTEENDGKKVWDKYSIIINGNPVKTFKSSEGVILEDISKNFSQGSNQVILTASKDSNFPGSTKNSWYKIIIGEGHEENKKIVIDKTLIQLTRFGSDTEPASKSANIVVK